MTSASLSASSRERPPVERHSEDRWARPTVRRFSLGMMSVVLVSLGLHGAILATAMRGGPQIVSPPQEISVEIVQEKAPEKPTQKTEPSKLEPPKPETPKLEPTKPEPAKSEPAKPEPVQAKAPETPKPARDPAADKPAPAEPKATEEAAALRKEFEALTAERAALESQRETARAEAPAKLADSGLGPLPDSFQAVALPATTATGAADVVGYRDIVFSQLAKANKLGKTRGFPGSTGVHFLIDDVGALVSVEIVHPSGIPRLDQEALAIVHKAAPFPPPPQGAQRAFDANVSFLADGER